MNILLINHYAGSMRHGMEYRPYYMAREWVRSGIRVQIAAASFSHVRSEQPSLRGSVQKEVIDGIQYSWIKTPTYNGNGVQRALNMWRFVAGVWLKKSQILDGFRPSVVIASSTYPLDILPARSIARSFKAKLVYEVHDLWPLSLIELGGMSRHHPFVMMLQAAENMAYRVADKVVSMLPLAEGHMRDHGMAPHKFAYVPNGVVVDEWNIRDEDLRCEHTELVVKLKQSGRFLVGYAGAHGLANALETLIEAADLLRDRPVDVLLVGAGPEKGRLNDAAASRGLRNVHFLSPVPKAAMPRLLNSLDACYIGLKREPIFRFGISPNKLMDYMIAGKPIIQAIDAGNDIVSEAGCGISVRAENAQAVSEAILNLMRMTPEQRDIMGARGKAYVLQHHDYRVLAQQFLNVIRE